MKKLIVGVLLSFFIGACFSVIVNGDEYSCAVPSSASGGGGSGISGLTTGTIPVATSATAIGNGPFTVSGATITTVADTKIKDGNAELNLSNNNGSSLKYSTTGLTVLNGSMQLTAQGQNLIWDGSVFSVAGTVTATSTPTYSATSLGEQQATGKTFGPLASFTSSDSTDGGVQLGSYKINRFATDSRMPAILFGPDHSGSHVVVYAGELGGLNVTGGAAQAIAAHGAVVAFDTYDANYKIGIYPGTNSDSYIYSNRPYDLKNALGTIMAHIPATDTLVDFPIGLKSPIYDGPNASGTQIKAAGTLVATARSDSGALGAAWLSLAANADLSAATSFVSNGGRGNIPDADAVWERAANGTTASLVMRHPYLSITTSGAYGYSNTNAVFNNTGSSGSLNLTLQAGNAIGTEFIVITSTANNIVLLPDTGVTIYDGTSTCSSVTLAGLGSRVTTLIFATDKVSLSAKAGSVTCTP